MQRTNKPVWVALLAMGLCLGCGSVVEPPRCVRWEHVAVPDDSGRGSVVLSVCAEYSKT